MVSKRKDEQKRKYSRKTYFLAGLVAGIISTVGIEYNTGWMVPKDEVIAAGIDVNKDGLVDMYVEERGTNIFFPSWNAYIDLSKRVDGKVSRERRIVEKNSKLHKDISNILLEAGLSGKMEKVYQRGEEVIPETYKGSNY